jgi:hypothetical protein
LLLLIGTEAKQHTMQTGTAARRGIRRSGKEKQESGAEKLLTNATMKVRAAMEEGHEQKEATQGKKLEKIDATWVDRLRGDNETTGRTGRGAGLVRPISESQNRNQMLMLIVLNKTKKKITRC